MMTKSHREWRIVLGILCAGGLVWCSWASWMVRCYHRAIRDIETEMENNRFAIAANKLGELRARCPGSDEVRYLLGTCEQKRGRSQAAVDVLAQVTPGSEFAVRAIFNRMRVFYENGHFATAEQVIFDAAKDPRNGRTDLHVLLVPLYSQMGCLDESKRMIEDHWQYLNSTGEGASERAIDLVRMHIEIDFKPNPLENVRAYLDPALRMAPEDDRVWLGQANLAMRTRNYDEAKRWLDACVQRRPLDILVWHSMLKWSMEANCMDVVLQSLPYLPVDKWTPAELHRLNTWLAFQRGDIETERLELERLVEADPADLSAHDRLIQLVEKGKQPAEVNALIRKKTDIEQLRTRYKILFDRQQPIRDAIEMAQLAEHLGRVFEAQVFLALTISAAPERKELQHDLERLSRSSTKVANHDQSLADVLALGLGNKGRIDSTP